MMPDLDEISVEIGALKAQVTEGNRQREAQFRKLDRISDQIHELAGQIKLLADQLSAVKKELDEDIRPAVKDFKSLKNKGIGVLAVVALMGGTIVTAAQWAWSKIA